MNSGKIACAVVGLGRIGSTLESDPLREKPCSHVGAIVGNQDCALVAGCDIKEEARHRFFTDWPNISPKPRLYTHIDELLSAENPDLVVVATYPQSHLQITAKAARKGVPLVICEKPLAYTVRDARRIVAIHKKGATKILVNHERRYSADYRLVQEAVRERRYGRLLSIKGTLYFGRAAKHKDVLLHDGTHLIDIINFLTKGRATMQRRFGSMHSALSSAFLFGAVSAEPGVDGRVSDDRRLKPEAHSHSSVPVVIEVGAERDHLVFEVELSFEYGRIRVGNGVLQFEKSVESPYYSGYRSLVPDETPVIEKTGYFEHMIADAVACVRTGKEPDSGASDGLTAMQFIRSIRALL